MIDYYYYYTHDTHMHAEWTWLPACTFFNRPVRFRTGKLGETGGKHNIYTHACVCHATHVA